MMMDSAGIFDATSPPLSRLDSFDPRGRVICAFITVLTLAGVRETGTLAVGSVLPIVLLCLDGRARAKFLMRSMFNINKAGVFIWIFLPLTYPGERLWGIMSYDGLFAALIITWKLNIMSLVLLQMVVSMGVPAITDTLGRLGVSLKMRMLLMLTMRYVFLLSERMTTMWRAVCMRSKDIKGLRACRAFACMVGTTLIHSSDRAERSILAMRCRGGADGFSHLSDRVWNAKDFFLCALFLFNAAFIWFFSLISSR